MIELMIKNEQVATTTLQVAEQFGRLHRDVLKKIRRIENDFEEIGRLNFEPVKNEEDNQRNIALVENEEIGRRNLAQSSWETSLKFEDLFFKDQYENEQGKLQPMYVMNRDGFMLLVLGFTGIQALSIKLKFIEAFNEMEEALKERTINYGQLTGERIIKRYNELEVYEKPFSLKEPKKDKYIFAITQVLKLYGIKSMMVGYVMRIREAFKQCSIYEFEDVVIQCYERDKLNAPYLTAVMENMYLDNEHNRQLKF